MATAEPSGHHQSGDVSIAFNAGPLAQMGLSIPLDAAYQLAVGAYGSFKAKLRSKSLVEKLQVSGATLQSRAKFPYGVIQQFIILVARLHFNRYLRILITYRKAKNGCSKCTLN